jgi:hypothetical protein
MELLEKRSSYLLVNGPKCGTEDELLHRYNDNLRKAGKVYPGSGHDEEEL